ncbi:MAG: mechanosensitive ion channel [Betaproteobacteria bacterium]|nr:mechanosensitive ion channel [Betaproteobacteria bacterium]
MNEQQFLALLHGLWGDFQQPDFLWQAAALCLSLALGWWLARQLRRRSQSRGADDRGALQAFGADGLRRLAFPLLSLLLVLVSRAALRYWGHVSLLDLAVPLLLSLALVRGTIYLLRRAFSPGGWLAISERYVATTIWVCLAIYITGLAGPLIETLEQVTFRVGKQNLDLWMLLNGAVTVLVTVLVALWLGGLAESRLMAARHLDSSLRVVLGRVVKALLSLMALLLSLSLIGIDITALSVFGGALAVGLGFGLQKIASNYVSGFIILLDRSIRIGNVVAVDAATSGVVTQITTRYTVLKTLTGTEVIIPNEYLVSNIVRNQSFTDTQVRLAAPVQVAYRADLELAMRLMEEVARAHPRVLVNPAPRVLLTAFGDSGINLELGFWISDPQEGTGNVRSDINLAIWRLFREHGVEIPFPQREIRLLGEPSRADDVATK